MSFVSIGDLARHFQMSRHIGATKAEVQRTSQELASGLKSNLGTRITGDLQPLVRLERSLRSIDAFKTARAEADLQASIMQNALEQIGTNGTEMAAVLLNAGTTASDAMIDIAVSDALSRLSSVVGAFNSSAAGRYGFSGAATDRPALSDARTMVDALKVAVAGQTTATGVVAAVDSWFDSSGGGFEAVGYLGSTAALAPTRLSETAQIDLKVSAFDQEARDQLKGFALAALVSEGVLSNNLSERAQLTRISGEIMVNAQAGLATMRSHVGAAEARIAQVTQAAEAERSVLDQARTDLLAADPYEAASKLEAARGQLERIFMVTSRLSRLSLSDYLR